MENGAETIRLTVECLNASEMLSTCEYNIEVSFVYNNGTSRYLNGATYSLKLKELCVWNYLVSKLYSNFGTVDYVTFLVKITPFGKIDYIFNNQGKSEYFTKYICIVLVFVAL